MKLGRYYYDYYEPSKPKKVKDGIKAKSQRGSFGKSWWSKRWISVLESFGWSNRLQRGRTYARKGQVVDIDIDKGKVKSHVQGSQSKPYKVEIEMVEILDKDWEKAADAMSEQAIFAAKLLAGEMPEDIEEAFKSAKVNLFPDESDIETDCSCPDFANPCKHIAAVYYLLGERFDEDPFLIFLLRGRSKDELMKMLRKRRTESSQPSEKAAQDGEEMDELSEVEVPELSASASFWELKEPMDNFRVEIGNPDVEMGAIKRLGKPQFWNYRKDLFDVLKSTYKAASKSTNQQTENMEGD